MAEVTFDIDDPALGAAAWGRLAEPGDPQAGELVGQLGSGRALHWLLSRAHDGPGDLWSASVWQRARARWSARLEGLDPVREVRMITRLGGCLLHPGDPRWPERLGDLGRLAPHALWVRGEPGLLRMPAVALVGARASTAYGEHVAGDLSASLADGGLSVVSGGAYGIDAVAHRAALSVGGATVAVMAGGLDRFYPAGNADLLGRVAEVGAVVAEVGPGSAPSRSRFLTRNRLIAALADVCVVVEAGWRSGSLSTAGHAATLMRPVAAVPGPITSAASAGCHRLIRDQAAVCVTDAAEVRELVDPIGTSIPADREVPRPSDVPPGLDPVARLVWEALPARGSAGMDSVARVSGLAPSQVRAGLGALELAGYAVGHRGTFRRTTREARGQR